MKQSLVAAAALAAGIAIAAPMLAGAADGQAPAAPSGMPGMGGMRGMMGMHDDERGMGGMGERGIGMGHHMREMMMRRMGQLTPQQRCEERLARRAGMVAYTAAKLNLTAEQRPLWDKLQGQMQTASDRQRQLCAGMKPAAERGQETILDRMTRREQFLSARLQALHDTRPALEQLYQALSPEQKAIIDHPFRGR